MNNYVDETRKAAGKRNRVILSAILPAEGGMLVHKLTLEQAKQWLDLGYVVNYVQHDTVRLLGIEPATSRESCPDTWEDALVIKPLGRLDRREKGEYSLEEIESIGYEIWLVQRFFGFIGDMKPVLEPMNL